MKNDTEYMKGFSTVSRRGFYRPEGEMSAGQTVDMITAVLALARTRKMQEMLISLTRLSGFDVPGPAFRRWAVRRWAGAAEGVHVAVVARAEHICPQKTGLLVAAEEGLRAEVCQTEAAALAWLDEASS